eukprot:gb/GECH01005393.1/.p1 GENE.gb/GECH01005393.1/~~gb/GECH01005393.1/.p1  ORF type:complete len:204 (+),score=43.11 gb/GECH01005393.1/:1-612(+)
MEHYLKSNKLFNADWHLVDVGCDNVRDSLFFFRNGVPVVAVDQAATAIDTVKEKIRQTSNTMTSTTTSSSQCPSHVLHVGDFATLPDDQWNVNIGVVYSRFTLHAVDAKTASFLLHWANTHLEKDGIIAIEARSTKSSLYGKGTPAGRDAFICGHYRRFILMDELCQELKSLGFHIVETQEKDGVAKYKDDDPVVVRVIAKKS